MTGERFKAIVVGGGPAGLAAATTIARGGVTEILLLERGSWCGSKNVMGGILFTPSLERLFPRIWETGAPLERPVTRRTFSLLSAESSADFSFRCGEFSRPPFNHSFTVLRGPFDRWFAAEAEKAGVNLLTGIVVEGLVRDAEGRVTGVRTRVDEGTDPQEGILSADLVILAEGANALIAEREGLRPKILPQDSALAVKEIIGLSSATIMERFHLGEGDGEGREYYGEAVAGLFGSGFIYTNKESLSVGVAASVRDLSASGLSPHDLLERFKAHPAVRCLLEGGGTLEYAAHLIPEGGFYRLGRLFGDGLMVVGDAAGLVNVSPYHEGANLGIASGIFAGETALEALSSGNTGAEALAAYRRRLDESFVLQDMSKFAGLPGFLKENPQLFAAWPRSLMAALQDLFTISEEPKQALENRALDRLKNEIGVLPLFTFLWGLRGATKSLYHDATEKLMGYLQRNW